MQYWMSGYYNAAANSDVLDLKRLQNNSAKVMAYCKKNKSDSCRPQSKKTPSKVASAGTASSGFCAAEDIAIAAAARAAAEWQTQRVL